jgi:peptidoglycan hydrolase-like protein with peptidoglycan-binding domain
MSQHNSRKRLKRTFVTLLLIGVLAGGAVILMRRSDPAPAAAAPIFKTATVERGDLTVSESIDGSVELSDVTTVLHRIDGSASSGATTGGPPGRNPSPASATTTETTQIVTSIVTEGSAVAAGTVLYSVESAPVVALPGVLPAWRTLSTSSADGIDVQQLEQALVALGYDPTGTLKIDTHFTSATQKVVKAWQAGYGMEETGTVTLGSVVFVDASTTVAAVDVAVGDEVADGDAVLSLATSEQQVVIDVPDDAQAYFTPGLAVTAAGTAAKVTLLRSVERAGEVVVEAVITPDEPIADVEIGSTVKVKVTATTLSNALLVPTEALVSLIDGSYALQVVADDETTSFAKVTLLGVAGSKAAISGEGIVEGTRVLQPV